MSEIQPTRILIVDTSTLTRQILSRILHEELGNVEVTTASGGEEALQILAASTFDLITTSLLLSDMDGLALSREIRNSDHRYTPLVVVSGDADSRLLREGFEAGVTDYFDKSNGYKAFGAFIQSFIQRQSGLTGHILFVEDSRTTVRFTGQILEKHGLTFTHTASAEHAYQLLEQQRQHPDTDDAYDMVITDFYTLGEMTGGDLLHAIRAKFHYSQQELPVLVLTSADEQQTQVEIFHAGANDFVAKPIVEEIFMARIRALLLIKHQFDALKRQTEMIRWVAVTDSLTGVRSRRYLVDNGQSFIADPTRQPVWAMIIDIDHFKLINDNYGHITGDHVLAALGELLNQSFPEEIVVRFGGEEFCILAQDKTVEQVLKQAEKLRLDVSELNPAGVAVTISVGVVGTHAHPDMPLNEFIRQADIALYMAKENGRNQVCITTENGPEPSPWQGEDAQRSSL